MFVCSLQRRVTFEGHRLPGCSDHPPSSVSQPLLQQWIAESHLARWNLRLTSERGKCDAQRQHRPVRVHNRGSMGCGSSRIHPLVGSVDTHAAGIHDPGCRKVFSVGVTKHGFSTRHLEVVAGETVRRRASSWPQSWPPLCSQPYAPILHPVWCLWVSTPHL